jgi:hypothetical protein
MHVDQSLVLAAKIDVVAYNTLTNTFEDTILRMVADIAWRNVRVDRHDAESALRRTLHDCIEQFDESMETPFEHLLNVSWRKTKMSIHRTATRRPHETSLDAPTLSGATLDIDDGHANVADVVVQSMMHDWFVAKAAKVDPELARIVSFIAAGRTYEDIARSCGQRGNADALKMWTMRRIADIGKAIVAIGDEVIVYSGTYRGSIGEVVRHATGDRFSHVVRLQDGRERAFAVEELRLKEAM